MKKIIYVLAFIFLFFLNLDVFALTECNSSDLSRLKELAKNVEFTYEYHLEDANDTELDEWSHKLAYWNVTAKNLNNDIIVRISNDDRRFTSNAPTIENFINGATIQVEILAYTKSLCSGKVLANKTINLPNFNVLSLRDECKDNKDFKYCKEYGNYNNVTEEKFLEELEKYKNNGNNSSNDLNSNLKNFFQNYWIYLVIVILLIIIVVSYIIFNPKRKRKDRDL